MTDEEFNTVTVGVQVRDDVVVISDPEEGNTSITNAIDSVLAQVYAQNPDAPRVVLYRNAQGVYDGVAVDEEGQFRNFYPIQTRDADHAAEVAVAFVVEAPERFH
jgi:hypothetical protein